MTTTFTTTLKCGACLSKVTPGLEADTGIVRWNVDLQSPQKKLTVEGNAKNVPAIFAAAGFHATPDVEVLSEQPASYYPLALIVAYLLGIAAIIESLHGHFDFIRAMRHFMAGFFLTFSFFKLLDVRGFADSFAMYDLLAYRSRLYALAYPFIELLLGMAYALDLWPMAVNATTLVVMMIGTAGIIESLWNRRRVRCACLGSVFNLPMSRVTLIEDLSMAAMAAWMLAAM